MMMEDYIRKAQAAGASDLHLTSGLAPRYRINGAITDSGDPVLTESDCRIMAQQLAGEQFAQLEKTGELDIALTLAGVRCRLNLFRRQGSYAAAVRLLRDSIPRLEDLGLPPVVEEFCSCPRGLILVTGETGSGKSTTLAAILDRINHTSPMHILTLEDPVEYLYQPDRCLINQREVGRDTLSFASGLRAALREDPDVILVGEMRDLDTIQTALTAAETGHLVFGTVHTSSAADTIDRIVDVFPEQRQQQIRLQLSMSLKAVASQQLLPRADGKGRVLACEIMKVNDAIRNLIREGKTPQIRNTIQTSGAIGNISMERAVQALYRSGTITKETLLSVLDGEASGSMPGSGPADSFAGRWRER